MKETSQPKLHPLLVRAVAQALVAIFFENRHADKVIEQTLKSNPKAGSRDRAFIAETTYDVLRYYRYYSAILGRTPRVEADFWQMVGIHFFLKSHQLPDWAEFKTLKIKDLDTRAKEAAQHRAVKESVPEWLDEMAAQQLPDKWDKTLNWLNRPAQVVLRTNRLKTDRKALQQALLDEGIETKAAGTADALVLAQRQNIFKSPLFKKGWFEVQDYSSQLVAQALAPEPGMRVVDACAGGGGKTLHLAALLQNKGSLIALDTFAWKLDALRLRARRAGATNIETRPIESRKTIKRLYNSADRLLLDVPCSGLGVLRRNPDTKWKLTPEHIDQLRATQQEILQAYSPITKPGGRMVYATCSILPSENQDQVQQFLNSEAGKNFQLLEEKRILPQDEGFDGFYIAVMQRSEK
ncbi:MAG TPA: RNA methyltransferase [Saprospiraceae bacterium]|nr:RNA methyltransferase [Saprospiraceae bacterium]HPI09142.1 RNA methyltransferase [Saprospiraceae bacterium]